MKKKVSKDISKKAFLFYDFALVAFTLILLSIILFTFSLQGDKAKNEYEQSAPNLKNPFPISFIQSFLYVELNSSQKKILSLPLDQEFRVMDLLQKEYREDIEGKIYEEIRLEYLKNMQSYGLLNQYAKTPLAANIVDINHLLVRVEISSLKKLDCLEKENYAFYLPYIPKISSTIIAVVFESSTSCAIKNSHVVIPNTL